MNKYLSAEYADLKAVAANFKQQYQEGDPYPHISFKNFFNEEMLGEVLAEFPDLSKKDAIKFDNPKERKLAGKGELFFGEKTKDFMRYLNSEPFLQFLQEICSINETIIGDPYFHGAGLHEIKRGGLLKLHADFAKHPIIDLDRRINVLVYLNKDWKEEYGGHFELWDKDMKACRKKILPEFNTLAMFNTTDFSFHGHPDPLNCPEERSRKSMALYYYSNGRPASEIDPHRAKHTTAFVGRKGNEVDKEIFSNRVSLKEIVRDITPPIILKAAKAILKK